MRFVKAAYRRVCGLFARTGHRLRRLFRAADSYAHCQGGWHRSVIPGAWKACWLLYHEGPQALIERLRWYSKRPHLAYRRHETHQMLGRISDLDIYGRTCNLDRARSVCAGQSSLRAAADEFAGLSVLILAKDFSQVLPALLQQLAREREVFRSQGYDLEILIGAAGAEHADKAGFLGGMAAEVCLVTGMQYDFSRCNNELASRARGEVLLFLDAAILLPEIPGGLLRSFEKYRSSKDNGVFGFATHREGGREVQHMGIEFLAQRLLRGLPEPVNQDSSISSRAIPEEADYPAVTGACLMLGRKLFFDVNGFDTAFVTECQSEAICLEVLRLGYRNACLNIGRMIHFTDGNDRIAEEQWADRAAFLRKYGSYIETLLSERSGDRANASVPGNSMGVAA